MLNFSRNEDHAPSENLAVFRTSLEAGTTANHVIHFIFAMRFLRIDAPWRQHVETSTHRRHAEKFSIKLSTLSSRVIDFGKIRE